MKSKNVKKAINVKTVVTLELTDGTGPPCRLWCWIVLYIELGSGIVYTDGKIHQDSLLLKMPPFCVGIITVSVQCLHT